MTGFISQFFQPYKNLSKAVLTVIAAEFCIQLVNATFMNMLPLYFKKIHYTDASIAGYLAFRFLGVFLLALPLGLWIKGKPMKPLFLLSAVLVPLFAICILIAIESKNSNLIYLFQLLWGASFTLMQVPILPYVIRHCSPENQTAGISLSYSTWSFAGIVSGILIVALDHLNPVMFDEKAVMIFISGLSFAGVPLLWLTRKQPEILEPIKNTSPVSQVHQGYDWKRIAMALFPTLIIAIGAGLTIQFMSLFFAVVHGMDKGTFSVFSAIAALLVAFAALLVPAIKRTIGFKVAVPLTQSFAVIALVAMALTVYFSPSTTSLVIAVVCYLLRQPLMNVAGPMTSEIVMNYVGDNNREIVSALTSAIWSGSWFISGLMVKFMFSVGLQFVHTFYITAILYTGGIIGFVLLIKDFEMQKGIGIRVKKKG